MTNPQKPEPSVPAMRASKALFAGIRGIGVVGWNHESIASIIDRETGLPELIAAARAMALQNRFESDPDYGVLSLERDMKKYGWVYNTHGPVGFYPAKLMTAAIAKSERGVS